jgi:lysozyme
MNDAGMALLKRFEGCRLQSYYCPAGVLTIGYGHTGNDVSEGQNITQEDADNLLRQDLARFKAGVANAVTIDLTDNQQAALVCFAYNVGLANLTISTLLRLLNSGDYAAAAEEFLKWDRAAGRVLPGLLARREAERELFLTP